MMQRKKTGGRKKGSTNKTKKYYKYEIYKDEIIILLAREKSQAFIVRKMNKSKNADFKKSGLCEYIRDENIFESVSLYIKDNSSDSLLNLGIKQTKKYNPIYTLKKENSKYNYYYINEKTNKIHFSKHTLHFNSGLKYLFNINIAQEELENILLDYDSNFEESEIDENIYQPIKLLIQKYDTSSIDKMSDSYTQSSTLNENCSFDYSTIDKDDCLYSLLD